jgi:16S rRNA (cytosine1402-N4)-methyltransferase|tara:strand:- start:137 stop:1027 length:891 start_codon:yes stop_codon:yes gene_type:complete
MKNSLNNVYHNPVMLFESVNELNIRNNGTYLDLTFGGGSYSRIILSKLENGRLFSFDYDYHINKVSCMVKNNCFFFINSNFRFMKNFLARYSICSVDGIIVDFGLSSYQLDDFFRGFSFKFNFFLDMRMNRLEFITAKDILNNYTKIQLLNIFKKHSNLNDSILLVNSIILFRKYRPINTIFDLRLLLDKFIPKKYRFKYYSKIFQSIRMEVNDEISSIFRMIFESIDILKNKSKLVTISYHSREDNLIKNIINNNTKDRLKSIKNKKNIILSSNFELNTNKRSRSAKLRVIEKII